MNDLNKEVAEALLSLMRMSHTEQHLESCENALEEKDEVLEAQSDYISELEDENYELTQENKELSELVALLKHNVENCSNENKKVITLNININIVEEEESYYDVLVGIYNLLCEVDGLNKTAVNNLKEFIYSSLISEEEEE